MADYAMRFGHNDKHLQTFKENCEQLAGQCKFSDSTNDDCSVVGALYDEQTERKIAEYILEWWISKLPFKQWYADKFIQQRLDFDE